jgi:putative flippase GtrA
MAKDALYFILIGGSAAAINVAARAAFNLIVPFEAAIVLAFPIALTFAFLLNRTFVFHGARAHDARAQYVRFAIVNIGSLGLIWAISVGLARFVFPAVQFIWHADDIAHAIGVAAPALSSYFLHRSYTFADPKSR